MNKEELALEQIKQASILLDGNFTVLSTYSSTTKKEGRKIVVEYEKMEEKDEKEQYDKIPSRY
tara:strand:- start:18 stop:206 length:189 start_codon:yes stop_codon:yes gene_type:complete